MLKIKTQTLTKSNTLLKLFQKVSSIADDLEDMIEDGANYRPDFLKELKISLKQASTGKVKKIRSMTDL